MSLTNGYVRLKNRSYILTFFLVVFYLTSCNKSPQADNLANCINYEKYKKLENYKKVENYSSFSSLNTTEKFIDALIDVRNVNYDRALLKMENVKEVYLSKNESVLKNSRLFFLAYYDLKSKLSITNWDDVNFMNSYLKEIDSNDYQFKVSILAILSKVLRNKGKINLSLSCSSLALSYIPHLQGDTSSIFKAYNAHAINLHREYKKNDTHFFSLATNYCDIKKNPRCKYLHLLKYSSLGANSIQDFEEEVLKQILNNEYHSPKDYSDIILQLSYLIEGFEDELQITLPNQYSSRDSFYNKLYDIDDMIKFKRYTIAEFEINSLEKNIESTSNQFLSYLVSFRKAHLFHEKFLTHRQESDLFSAYEASKNIIDKKLKTLIRMDGLHLADIIHESFEIQMNCIYELSLIHNSNSFKDELFKSIQIGKLFRKNLYGYQMETLEKIDSIGKSKYLEKLKNVNRIEHILNDYQVKEFEDEKMLEALVEDGFYLLNRELLYNQKITMPTLLELKDLSIQQSQLLDISIFNNVLYLSYFNNSDVRIIKLHINSLSKIIELKPNTIEYNKFLNQVRLLLNLDNLLDLSKKSITIIPDGLFNLLPIEALGYDSLRIIDYFDVSYLSNAFELKDHSNTLINREKSLIYSYSSPQTIADDKPKIIPELPSGYNEAKEIINLLGVNDVTFDNLELGTIENLDLIHLSTHSHSSPNSIFGNYFYTRDQNSIPKKIYGFELVGLNIHAKNIILSSCESGKGLYKNGAGTFSLSRNFLNSGAESVTKSIWKVNEKSTTILLTNYHKNLILGQSVSKALANAKRTVKKMPKYAHPYYWAGFVLEGNPHVYLEQPENSNN